ncbi:MAG: hypothetical protein UU09_C0036G0003 [Microgenomates group bacterium GW2011_GWA2_40_6]|nr:MAG: hypothetical protein UU09_C0036G0003 [Microgenomates group bacterium GW2011_GWA2_40_6]
MTRKKPNPVLASLAFQERRAKRAALARLAQPPSHKEIPMKKLVKFLFLIFVVLPALCCCGLIALLVLQPAPAATGYVPPAATEAPAYIPPVIVDDGSGEVRCEHKNAGEFDLLPGSSVNGGHVFAYVNGSWHEWQYVDNKVVVLRNNSETTIRVNSTDGLGLCNSASLDEVYKRFAEGCDETGCGAVMDINITSVNAEPTITTFVEAIWCAANSGSVYCLNIDK